MSGLPTGPDPTTAPTHSQAQPTPFLEMNELSAAPPPGGSLPLHWKVQLLGCQLHLPRDKKQAHPPYLDLWLGLGSFWKALYSPSQAASWRLLPHHRRGVLPVGLPSLWPEGKAQVRLHTCFRKTGPALRWGSFCACFSPAARIRNKSLSVWTQTGLHTGRGSGRVALGLWSSVTVPGLPVTPDSAACTDFWKRP